MYVSVGEAKCVGIIAQNSVAIAWLVPLCFPFQRRQKCVLIDA